MKRRAVAHPGLLALVVTLLIGLTACEDRSEYVKVRLASAGRPAPVLPAGQPGKLPLRVAVAAVISPKGTLESYSALFDYLGERVGRPDNRTPVFHLLHLWREAFTSRQFPPAG